MSDRSFSRFAGAAAVVVAMCSVLYAVDYLLLVPAAQKSTTLATFPGAFSSFAANPIPAELLNFLLALAGLATSATVIAVYRQLRAANGDWALWSLILGLAFSILTALDGAYTFFLLPLVSALYATSDAAVKASAVAIWSLPSPLNPDNVSESFLPSLWLLLTGWLILRTSSFPRLLGYLAFVAGIGILLMFVGTVTGIASLIVATGAPGALIVGPLFWLWVGRTLWTIDYRPAHGDGERAG